MTVDIDADRCAGCGLCEEHIPELFRMGEHHAEVEQASVPGGLENKVIAVAEDCPAEAIRVDEGD